MSGAYGYFPGCSLKGAGVAYEESLLALFRLLGLPLAELEDWNCCGATSYMSIDERSAILLSSRNLLLAHKAGYRDVVAPCSACYLVLRKAQDYMERYPRIGKEVHAALGDGDLKVLNAIRVRHPLEVLYTDVGPGRIRQSLVRQWHGGRVACYYGCQMVRPYAEADRAHDPMRMDELLRAAGVPTVDYSLKTKCCGGSLTGTTHEVGVRLNYALLREAARKGADAIATVCPLCQYNLDAYQREIRRASHEPFDMPILYFSQILGWALGADTGALGLRRAISGRKTVQQWFSERRVEKEAYA
ncbi:MAG TPA: CoB--CoM heterodisulfide reductase iron-sulfur subunit B family protein [Bryobacteraceae bacterium]|nr:CoB--CoM heterodisulfide reductase iron-sulfur subunit B family protein [Bryobacteraceae bacterium]